MNNNKIELPEDYWDQCVLMRQLWKEGHFASAAGHKSKSNLSRWLADRGLSLTPREVAERLYVANLLRYVEDEEAAVIARTHKPSWIITLSAIWGSVDDDYRRANKTITTEIRAEISAHFANIIRRAAIENPTAYDMDAWALRSGLIKRSERLEKRKEMQQDLGKMRNKYSQSKS